MCLGAERRRLRSLAFGTAAGIGPFIAFYAVPFALGRSGSAVPQLFGAIPLALLPLLRHRLIDPATIIIDSKSGTSGAGRAAKVDTLYCEVNEGFKAYGLPRHRHTPEIEQTLSAVAGLPVTISFTPHLVPANRGILSTCYAALSSGRAFHLPNAGPAQRSSRAGLHGT